MISVIVPAHNEAGVIGRTLQAMTEDVKPAELEIIVICNGCTDDTAGIARRFGGVVKVLETPIAGKALALNLGDGAAIGFPRVYADADVVVAADAIRRLAECLEEPGVLAVAPTPVFDLSACSWGVRAVYQIRSLLPSSRDGIGGSGVYALSEAGRSRFGEFPPLTADDGYVRIQFAEQERRMLPDARSKVFPPKTLKDLVATKTRAHYGTLELAARFPELWHSRYQRNHDSLAKLFRYPWLWPQLSMYCLVTLLAKQRARRRMGKGIVQWERDQTSRATA
jgi:glycosyltransferase involved in cell wall biosynthesis